MQRHDTTEPPGEVDPGFLSLPFRALADAALEVARRAGAEHADFRFERLRHQVVSARDAALEGVADTTDTGYAVRVLLDGVWGFASDVVLTPDRAALTAERALEVARLAAAMTSRRVVLAPEPVHHEQQWVSAYDVDPFTVATDDKVDLLRGWTARLQGRPGVDHAAAWLQQVHENKFYTDLAGTTTTQQRVRLEPQVEVFGGDADLRGRRLGAQHRPAGRTRVGVPHRRPGSYDWESELDGLPGLLAGKLVAPSVEAGRYDLVIHPSNLWLTIHESVGHATELDRALGYEANYAGTSFATPDLLGTLQYGSPVMHVIGDRTEPHGLSTIGFDDEGVQTRAWDIVRDGVLVGYQLDRAMAHSPAPTCTRGAPTGARTPTPPATSRSSGWPTCRCSPRPTARPPSS